MASLFDNLNSSDSEDDADYVPENESSDDEEPLPKPLCSSDDESETKKSEEKKDSNEGDKMGEDEKKKANIAYESFLKEVQSEMSSKVDSDRGIGLSPTSSSAGSTSALSSDVSSEKNLSAESTTEKLVEVVEFAGEKIAVAKDGTILSSESSDSPDSARSTPTVAPLKRKGGLQSVLGIIQNKKAKVSTLKKSALDWNTFKKQEGIAEELERFNKGKGGYTERQRFLQRSDSRSFEIEREMRLSRLKKS